MTTRFIASTCALVCALAAAPAASAQPADGALVTRPGALLGRVATFRGTLEARRTVVLQRQRADGSWKRVARTTRDLDRRVRRPLARRHARRHDGPRRHRRRPGRVEPAHRDAHRLPPGPRHLVRPRLLRQADRVRSDAEPRAARRRASHAALRHARRDLLPREVDHRPGRRPRPVRQRRALRPDLRDRRGRGHDRHEHDRRHPAARRAHAPRPPPPEPAPRRTAPAASPPAER